MKFKKVKYNILALIVILLMTSAVILKVGFIDQLEPGYNINTPTLPGDDNNEENNFNRPYQPWFDDETSDTSTSDPNVPSTSNPIKLLNYSLNKTQNCSSYKTSVYYTLNTTVANLGSAKTLTEATVTKIGDTRYEYIVMTGDKTANQFYDLNRARAIYFNGGDHTYVLDTGKDNLDIETASIETFNGFAADEFYYDRIYPSPINFTKNSLQCTASIQINSKTGKTEYVVKGKIIDKTSCPENFMRTYNSYAEDLKIESADQSIVFTIDKDSGYLKSFTQTEKYVCKHSSGATMYMNVSYTQSYSNYNEALTIELPNILQGK